MHAVKIKTRLSRILPASPTPRQLAEVLVASLAERGFDCWFGIPGRHVQALFHHMPAAGVRHVLTRHEQGAVFMADGYARASGRPGLAIGTAGPGAGNMITGVANAFADGVPVLCLTGAPARHFGCRGAFQELGDDHTGITPSLFAPITRYNAQLSHPDQWSPALQLALTALAGGGPVHVGLPADLLEQPCHPALTTSAVLPAITPDPAAIVQAVRLLVDHPDAVIVAGRGALEAAGPLLAVAERLQIPVVTTIHGRGALDEDHFLALGPYGFSASHWAERYLATHRPTLVLAVGTSLRELSTNVFDPALGGSAGLIHVTRDVRAIGRHYPTRLGVVADTRAFLEALLPHLPERPPNMALAHFKAEVPRFDAAGLGDEREGLSPRRVVQALRQVLEPSDMLFADTGNAVPWSVRYFPVHQPGTYFAAMHLAAMGWGVAAAIGAAIAVPDRRVVALVGDGCFQMAGMEIATAVQEQVPVVWVVLNDSRLNMVYQGSSRYYGDTIPGTTMSPVSAAKVAEGLGALGLSVSHPAELLPALTDALEAGCPAVVDVAIDPRFEPPMGGRADALRRFEQRGMEP